MRLTDLEPRWLVRDGQRVGLVFKSPTKPHWFQSCMFAPTPHVVQRELFNEAVGHLCEKPEYGYTKVQGCNEACGWTVAGGAANATFETLAIAPSIDGSAGGLWHGFITNGDIVGGI
jgi:hypothetical protein